MKQPQRNYNDIEVIKDNFGVDVTSEKGSSINLEIISEVSQFEETPRGIEFDVVKEISNNEMNSPAFQNKDTF